jgi:hypothetical protein
MTEHDEKRFVYHGHAIGVGAHFHRLDTHQGLDLHVPTLGASVLPVTGGKSEATASDFKYEVSQPVAKKLLSVRRIDTKAHGRYDGTRYQTDIATTVEYSTWAERVHFDLLSLSMQTTHNGTDPAPNILIQDVKINGLQLGDVTATIDVDGEPFSSHGTREAIESFWATASARYREENAARFPADPADPSRLLSRRGYYYCSVVRSITLSGPAKALAEMRVEGNTIIWDDPNDNTVGFGKIILGEILIGSNERRVALARLQMGCPVGGSGTGGEGQTNGTPTH